MSGGLDSSSIAAIASEKYSKNSDSKFTAIHAKSSQVNNDESHFAQMVSEYCHLDLEIVEPSIKEFVDIVDEVAYTQEEPFGSPSIFMQYFVMRKAKEIGCTVMLDGQGGDETLLGYERYYPAYLMSLGFIKFIKEFFNASKNSKLSLKELVQYFIYFTNAKIRLKRVYKKSNYIKKEFIAKINKDIVKENARNYLNIFNLQVMEILKTQMPHLLKYEDKNSMRNSIETRLPFIDYKALQTAIATKSEYEIKNGWTKYILRKIVENILPQSVVWRKNKFGFEAPTKTWIECISKQIEESIKKSNIVQKITNEIDFKKLDENQKWKLYNIAKWEEIYNVKID